MRGRVLVVAGSDSGGGAGIQADIKTITAHGAFAMSAVTALTAQNTLGVFGVYAVPPEFVVRQMEVVLDDLGADVVKTGMLPDERIIGAVARVLSARRERLALVVDPVMVAKGGARLMSGPAESAIVSDLLPLATLVTPNVPEAEALTGRTIRDEGDLVAAGEALVGHGAQAALVKGGHLEGAEVVDALVRPGHAPLLVRHPRLETRHTHGTGCTLASAISALLSRGVPLDAAVPSAIDYVTGAMQAAPGLGAGHGPLDHAWVFSRAR